MLALLLIPTLPLVRFNGLKKSFEITDSKTLEKQKEILVRGGIHDLWGDG